VGNEHPANPEFQINPYVPCPFEQRLWTSINSLGAEIIERNELTQKYKTIYP
jgi:hypothetical protein